MGKDKGKRYSAEEKREFVGLYEQSGYSVSRFCREMDLCYATLRRWLDQSGESGSKVEFVEVESEAAVSKGLEARIVLPNGIGIELGGDCGRESVVALAESLMRC